jgi:hypothetical protein
MTIKKFLTSVADCFAYDENDVLLFSSKTLLDSAMEVKLGSTEVRGGRGNQLLYTYYHTGALSLTLNDTQFNLGMLGSTVGSSVATSNSVYTEETITLGALGTGTVVGQPLAIQGTALYGWVTQLDGTIERVTFSSKTFATSSGTSGDVVCVRYYATDAASRSVTIPANVLPKIVRLVLSAQLNSSDEVTNKIGEVQIIIPKFSLSGSFTLSFKSDGVSQTPLSGVAYQSSDLTTASCSSEPVYAKIIEILDNANWYDGVVALAISGGDFTLPTELATRTLVVYAIRDNGDAPFVAPNADLDFTSATTGKATVGLHTGLVTGVDTGTSLITVAITAAPTIDASCTVTVPSP